MEASERQRVFGLLDFLSAYDARRNPPVHDVGDYHLYLLRDANLPRAPGIRFSPANDAWLSVDFVEMPPQPAIPVEFDGLLSAEPGDSWPQVSLPEEATPENEALVERMEAWLAEVWSPWAARRAEAMTTKTLYRDLYEVRDRLSFDREGVEFVWGFGRLRWAPSGGPPIDHPLFTMPVEVTLDERTHRLDVVPAGALEVETAYLSDCYLADRNSFAAVRNRILELDAIVDPWDQPMLEDEVRRLVRCVDHDGALLREEPRSTRSAVATMGWVLYLRRRRPDYQGFLDEMRRLYESETEPPDPLLSLVVDAPSTLVDGGDGDGQGLRNNVEPLLLPLPANEEQQRILTYAQHRAGVTVQGPPGTGKSHTIANIISHCVAYGRRVLVVAEKEQALKVLAEKLPADIRDLTVSVLGADEEGRRRLGSSITQIQTRVTGIDRRAADEAIERITANLDRLDRKVAEVTGRLLAARCSETEQLEGTWEVGSRPTPTRAAEWAAEHAAALGYIDDPLRPGTSCPLAAGEFAELVALIDRIGASRAEACAFVVPDPAELPSATQLQAMFSEFESIRAKLAPAHAEIASWGAVDGAESERLSELSARLKAELDWWCKAEGGWLARAREELGDPLMAGRLEEYLKGVRADRERIFELERELAATTVTLPQNPTPDLKDKLWAAHQRIFDRGKLGPFANDAKRALSLFSIDGRSPSTANDVRLCAIALERQQIRRQLRTRWNNGASIVDGPRADDDATPELSLGRQIDDLERALSFKTVWAELAASLASLGIAAPEVAGMAELRRLYELLELAQGRKEERGLAARLDGLRQTLDAGARAEDASPLWSLLRDALTSRDTEAWRRYREEATALAEIAAPARRLRELHARLSAVAPVWAARLLRDVPTAGEVNDLSRAWEWRQLETWLAAIASTGDPTVLQGELEQLAHRRRQIVEELVAERAWRRLADNLGDRQRAALNSYLQAINRYGKTGGKFAARWLAIIRQALNESKDAVPVWIMTTSRALSSFRPSATPPFDVLIIDEASQLGLETIPLLGLAKKAIVVGDDKQTSPENVGLVRQDVFNLLDDHVAEIPKYRSLFDPDNSLYDVAFQKFPDIVMLTEHFRCLPDIIQFSNVHSYENRIVPLRDQPPHPGWNALGAVKVVDGYREGDRNRPEAEAIVDLIERLHRDPDYEGMTFGVISLLGSTQSKLIWELLYDRLGPKVIEEREIRCGEPATFQGDERDVMILSSVVATDPSNPLGRIASATGRPAERRFNVAASRARQQMWIVYSVDPERLADGDLRRALIRHCLNPGTLGLDLTHLEDRCESEFERRVLRRVLARGYSRLRVNQPVGRYRIDLVIEGPGRRLAVECDGDEWHGEDAWHHDRARQEVLERAGWTFERIRGSAFYRDPDRALEPLWARLDELGIPPGDAWVSRRDQSTVLEVTTGYAAGTSATPEDRNSPEPRTRRPFTARPRSANGIPDASEIRAWARSQGLTVGARGRLHPDVLGAWDAAHPSRPSGPPGPFAGS